MPTTPRDLRRFPMHLGLGAVAVREPEFSGSHAWYADYEQRHQSDGAEGRLLTVHEFRGPWNGWEMHPHGDEVVVCLTGEITLIAEAPEGHRRTRLRPLEAVVIPPGIWHTADIEGEASALFITAGLGTEIKPR